MLKAFFCEINIHAVSELCKEIKHHNQTNSEGWESRFLERCKHILQSCKKPLDEGREFCNMLQVYSDDNANVAVTQCQNSWGKARPAKECELPESMQGKVIAITEEEILQISGEIPLESQE